MKIGIMPIKSPTPQCNTLLLTNFMFVFHEKKNGIDVVPEVPRRLCRTHVSIPISSKSIKTIAAMR